MTLQQLRYVTTVAETGTMSEAARRLFVSQPGLTKAIRELEQEMGIIIFDRTNKGIEPLNKSYQISCNPCKFNVCCTFR